MKQALRITLLLLAIMGGAALANAATAVVQVLFLPMQEAADAVRSQLSDHGKVAVIASKRSLIIDDSEAHIARAKALLAKLDQLPNQYRATLEISDLREEQLQQGEVAAGTQHGGWVQVEASAQQQGVQHKQRFQLRISDREPGFVEVGTLRSYPPASRRWLAGYGLLEPQGNSATPLRSGFRIFVSSAGDQRLRVRIVPWMQHEQGRLEAEPEMLINLGSVRQPDRPPSNNPRMRLNGSPQMRPQPLVDIVGAATTLTMKAGETVTLAAVDQDAAELGKLWLARASHVGKRRVVIRLRIDTPSQRP